MSKQQTAVEYLVNELTKYGYVVAPSFGHSIIDETINKAKQMERHQIIGAVIYGNRQEVYDGTEMIGRQYYKETFNQ